MRRVCFGSESGVLLRGWTWGARGLIGRTISHYKILERLGAGAGGEVFIAEDTRLERRVALKLISPQLAADPENLERFEREAKVLAALNHPHIVTIYSVEEEGEDHFLTMELVEGRTLDQLIPAEGMSFETFLAVALPLLDALGAAHDLGVTHRDLKPANLMVSRAGVVKILDFGLAKLQRGDTDSPTAHISNRTITQQGMLLGTLQYMSPEQVEGKPAGPQSDLFSIGAVFHEMLTGQRPFFGETGAALISSIFRDTPLAVTDLRPDLPGELAAAILRCLEKDPQYRYERAADLREDLAALHPAGPQAGLLAPSGLTLLAEMAGISPREPGARTAGTLTREGQGLSRPGRAISWTGGSTSRRAEPVGRRRARSGRSLPRWATGGLVLGLLAAAGFGFLQIRSGLRTQSAKKKIVVLQFENLGLPEDAYFAAGITEEITSRLASVRGLGVISRTSALQYDPRGKTVKQIGRDLGVGYLLEGSVRWDHTGTGPSRVRVTPQLIRVSDDTHLWSERYERDVQEIFEVQKIISEEVVQRLNVTLGERERQALKAGTTENLDAHLVYLRGMAYGRGASEEDARLAVEMFEKAVTLDPGYVEAYYRLSRSNSYLYDSYIDHTPERLARAKGAADRALELAPERPEGHRALARYYEVQRDFPRALETYAQVLRIQPDDSQALFFTGRIRVTQGSWEEGLRLMERALELDPQNGDAHQVVADVYQRLRRFPDADRALDRALAIIPDDLIAYYRKVDLYWCWYDDPQSARQVLETMPKQTVNESTRLWICQELYERNWQAALDRMQANPEDWYGNFPKPYYQYVCYLRLSKPQQARQCCETSVTMLEDALAGGAADPELHSILGASYAGLGRGEDAIREGMAAVALCPDSLDAFYGPHIGIWLAKIYSQVGEPEKALDLVDHYLRFPCCLTPSMLRKEPDWDRLRTQPRFKKLVETIP